MESSFRRSMKQWKPILWFVLASMIGSSLSVFFTKSPNGGSYIAKVNGNAISPRDYQRSLAGVRSYIASMQAYAAASKLPVDFLIEMLLGGSDLETFALENSIKAELMSNLIRDLHIVIGEKEFQEDLVKGLPAFLFNEQGAVNMQAYTDFVNRLGMTVGDYEVEKALEIKRAIVEHVVAASNYTPMYELADSFKQESSKKSFELLCFDYQDFLKKEQAVQSSDADLQAYFEKNKNDYRQQEMRRLKYFVLSAKDSEAASVDEESIQAYYEKNKSNQFRVAPKVSVRRMTFAGDTNGRKKAEDVHALVAQDPTQFAALAKQHSQDKNAAKNGGVLPLFSRGAHDAELENAAFRLQKEGDVSPVFKSSAGYEMVQLVERVNAVEKPLSEVREQIAKTLRARKAATTLKSSIEAAVHDAKGDDTALVNLAAKYKASIVDSAWLTKNGAYKGLEAQLAEKVFSKTGSMKKAGYFSNHGDYVVYFPAEVRESKIPAFNELKAKIAQDYAAARAHDAVRDAAKSAKLAALRHEHTLKDLANTTKARFIETGVISKKEKSDKLKDVGQLQDKLFSLSATDQIIEYAYNDDIYLGRVVQLVAEDKESAQGFEAAATAEKRNSMMAVQAFIASLRRNATIEVKKEALNAYKRQ